MRVSKQEKEAAREMLLKWLKPGDTVHTVLRHVSRSGMRRRIDLYRLEGQDATFLTGYASKVTERRWDDRAGGLVVDGCGMDMGFEVVYNLSYYLFPDGFECVGDRCPAASHSNGDRDYTVGRLHPEDGAYALRHRWL